MKSNKDELLNKNKPTVTETSKTEEENTVVVIPEETKPVVNKTILEQALADDLNNYDVSKLESAKGFLERQNNPEYKNRIDEISKKIEELKAKSNIEKNNVDSEGNIHSPIVKIIYSQGFNNKNELDLNTSTSSFTDGDSVYKIYYHQDGTITYQVAEQSNTFKNVKDTLSGYIEAFTEITNSFKSQTKINTLEPGILKEEDGKLIIVKKAKIEYSDTLKPFDGTIVGKIDSADSEGKTTNDAEKTAYNEIKTEFDLTDEDLVNYGIVIECK